MLEGPDVAGGDVTLKDISQQLQHSVAHRYRDHIMGRLSLARSYSRMNVSM